LRKPVLMIEWSKNLLLASIVIKERECKLSQQAQTLREEFVIEYELGTSKYSHQNIDSVRN
jgi:hypothetical protein